MEEERRGGGDEEGKEGGEEERRGGGDEEGKEGGEEERRGGGRREGEEEGRKEGRERKGGAKGMNAMVHTRACVKLRVKTSRRDGVCVCVCCREMGK